MIQSQDLLSRLAIAYNDCSSQADIDAKAQAFVAAYRAKQAGTYVTKGLTDGDPAVFITPDYQQILSRQAALVAMQSAIHAGDVQTAHADLDRANQIGVGIGFPVIACAKSDLEILCNAPGWTGRIASGALSGEFLSDMTVAKAIIEPALAEIPRPAPVQPLFPPMYLPGPLPGMVDGETFAMPDGTRYFYGSVRAGGIVAYYMKRAS